ncbi:MAG: hypothetical protein AAGG08_14725, partial [Actinomycetota bacterium]
MRRQVTIGPWRSPSLVRRIVQCVILAVVVLGGAIGALHSTADSAETAETADTVETAGSVDTSVGQPGSYVPVETVRLVDTRSADGAVVTPIEPLTPSQPLAVTLTGVAGIPDTGVGAIDLNVTVARMAAPGFISVYPCASGNDGTSRLNYAPRADIVGLAVAVQVIAVPDADGRVCFEASSPTDLIVDTSGWLRIAGGFRSVPAVRLVDTRDGSGVTAIGEGRLRPETPAPIRIAGAAGVPDDAVAVVLSVVATGADTRGFLSVFPCSAGFQTTSNLNFVDPRPRANAVTAPLDENGEICAFASSAVHLVVDLVGYHVPDLGIDPVTPTRVVDSRGGTGPVPVGRLEPFVPVAVDVVAGADLPADLVDAVSLNVTAVGGVGPGFMSVFPCDSGFQGTSSV